MIFDVLHWLTAFILSVIERTGYAGVFVLMMLESAAIPIPSEVTMPFAGFLAAKGVFNFWGVVLAGTLANLVGSWILWWVGRRGAREALLRYGRYVLISRHDIERGDRWFLRHGNVAAFFGRLLPVVRTFVSLPAGVARMPFKTFSLYTLLGSLPWSLGLAAVGWYLGERWAEFEAYFRKFSVLIAVLIVFGVGWYLGKHWRERKLFRQ